MYREAQNMHITVCAWMVKMESNLSRGGTLIEDLNHRCVLFIQVCTYQGSQLITGCVECINDVFNIKRFYIILFKNSF